MIHVRRDPRGPAVLSDPRGIAARERKKVEEFYADEKNRFAPFAFSAYRADEVKEALERMFHGKCAYCEARYAGTQPMDVEHWRPKGKVVDGGTEYGGYYWLASEWTNLLPSCVDCNRQRTQTIAPDGVKRSVGKAMSFPLEEGSPRATRRGETEREKPLLLDPCNDRPEEYLEFVADGVVRPRGGTARAKARASIDTYALNRSGLVEERRRLLRLIEQRIATIEQLMRILDDPRGISEIVVEDLIAHELAELRACTRPERPFSLMARQQLDAFLARLAPPAGSTLASRSAEKSR